MAKITSPRVAIIMGSKSDLPTMEAAQKVMLDEFGVESDIMVASAHRNPAKVVEFAQNADKKYSAIIAGAGMAAHLPGVIAAYTTLPVIGVPIESKGLNGMDALFSIVQMPPGIPVATVAINGAKNAGILAVEIMALRFDELQKKLTAYRKKLASA
jgi:5-(carboxyamino)imidazole ribonucleotide mutase